MRKLILALALLTATPAIADDYIGSMTRNPFVSDGIRNPFSRWNNPFYADSPANPFGPYGNPFSAYSWSNPFSAYGPRVYGGPFDNGDPYVNEELVSGYDVYGYEPEMDQF